MADVNVDSSMWKALLTWSAKQSDGTAPAGEDGQPVESKPMSKEDREFIESAMKEFVADAVDRLKKINNTLRKAESETTPEEKEEVIKAKRMLMEELSDWVCDLNHAQDLHAIGGFEPLIQHLNHSDSGLRWRSADVIATVVQNYQPMQDLAHEQGVTPKLLELISNDSDSTVKLKAMYAMSSLMRNHRKSQDLFLKSDGLLLLKSLLHSADERMARKALQILLFLVLERPACLAKLLSLGIVSVLAEKATSKDVDMREAALKLMVHILSTESAPKLVDGIHSLGLLVTLKDREQVLKGDIKDMRARGEDVEYELQEVQLIHRIQKACDLQ